MLAPTVDRGNNLVCEVLCLQGLQSLCRQNVIPAIDLCTYTLCFQGVSARRV